MDLQIKLANGCVLWCDASSFYDVYYIDIDDDRIELSDCDGFVIGTIDHNQIWDECAYIEYDANGHLYNAPIQKLWSNGIECF